MQRFTRAAEDAARAMLQLHSEDPDAEVYGLEVAALTGYGPGTVYTVLRRMAEAGWLLTRPEDPEIAHRERRPARVYYRVDPGNAAGIRRRLAEVDARRRAVSPKAERGGRGGSAPSP